MYYKQDVYFAKVIILDSPETKVVLAAIEVVYKMFDLLLIGSRMQCMGLRGQLQSYDCTRSSDVLQQRKYKMNEVSNAENDKEEIMEKTMQYCYGKEPCNHKC